MRAGKCWRLYPEVFHQNFMPPHTLAEMLRTPLEELVLQVRQCCTGQKEKGGARVVRSQGQLLVQIGRQWELAAPVCPFCAFEK